MCSYPRIARSTQDLLAALEGGLVVCHRFTNGDVKLTIRRSNSQRLEVSAYSFLGSIQCTPAELRGSLVEWQSTQSDISSYLAHFKEEVIKTLPKEFFTARLDFTPCKRSKSFPRFLLETSDLVKSVWLIPFNRAVSQKLISGKWSAQIRLASSAMSIPTLFKWRHYLPEIILLSVRWYCRYPLSYRNLEEMMAERGVDVSHSRINRWVLKYAPQLDISAVEFVSQIFELVA